MNREWMYRRFTSDGYISPEFHRGLESFIQFACGQPTYMDGNKIRCPCRKCKNLAYREVDTVRLHISSKGFIFNYHVWSAQGERQVLRERPNLSDSSSSAAGTSQYHQMVLDIAYWDTDAAKAVSERAKKNMLSEPDGPGTGVAKHRGGSRSAVAYSYQMARDQGVSIKDTIFPTFKKLHYSERDNTYTSGKAKRIAEEVEVELEDLTQDLPDGVSPTPAETSSIFVGIAQHPVKNRVFGVGSLFSVPSVQSRWEGGGDEAPSMPSDSTLRAELDAVRSKFEAAEKAREAAEKAQEDELEGVRSQLEASEKAREDMERRQDLLKELYQEQQQEQRELRQMYAAQQQVLEQILRERNTPPDM